VEFILGFIGGLGLIASGIADDGLFHFDWVSVSGIFVVVLTVAVLAVGHFDRLILTSKGICYINLGTIWRAQWADCSEFSVWSRRLPFGLHHLTFLDFESVVFDDLRVLERRGEATLSSLSKRTSILPSNYSMTAHELAELLNRRRAATLANS